MAMDYIDYLADDFQPPNQEQYIDYLSDEPQESLGKSLLYAPGRIAGDLGTALAKGLYHGIQGTPDFIRRVAPEIGRAISPINFSGESPTERFEKSRERSKQSAAGLTEWAGNLANLPRAGSEYFENRLNLLPRGTSEKIPFIEDVEGRVNNVFGAPQNEGDETARMLARNVLNVVPAGKAAGAVGSRLRPSNYLKHFGGNLSPEELARNLRITAGTETGLGDVIGSPMLKRWNENVLSKIPGTGVNNALQRTAGEVVKRGENLLQDIKGTRNIENVDRHLYEGLRESFANELTQKNTLYKDANKLAKEANLKLDLPTFAKQAADNLSAIEDTTILKHDPELRSLMNKITRYETPVETTTKQGKLVDKYGNPLISETKTKYPTLEEASLLKGKLNRLSSQYGASSNPADRHLAGVFGNLAKTLRQDIESGIEKSGHEGLKTAYKAAEENYQKNFSPFLDNEIYKFIGGKGDPDTLVAKFIKTGRDTDRGDLINKLVTKLPEKDRNLLGYRYLQRAMDENNVLNPSKLKTLISANKLGPRQFEALFPDPKVRNALRDYGTLVDMNTKGLKLMMNPENGQMSMDILPLLGSSKGKLLGKLVGGTTMARALRSEKTRNRIVNKQIKKSQKKAK